MKTGLHKNLMIVISLFVLTACSGGKEKDAIEVLESQEIQNTSTSKNSDTPLKSSASVTIDGKTIELTFDHQSLCVTGFHNDIGTSVSNDDFMLEVAENSKTNAWEVNYSIPLGNYKYTKHETIESQVSFENDVIKGAATVKQNTNQEIKHTISFTINCKK